MLMSHINHFLAVRARWQLTGPNAEDGQGLVEYSMILSLVMVVAIVALTGLGVKVESMLSGAVAAF